MRRGRLIGSFVLLLTVALAGDVLAKSPTGERHVGQTRGDNVDLGTSTLGHLELGVGPLRASVGLFDRLEVGSYLPPWGIGLIVPGSFSANGYLKARLFRSGRWSAGVRTAVTYGHLNDLDGDGLAARAWVWPTRLLFASHWTQRFATTVELTGVYTAVAAKAPIETDTEVSGVALARALHVGLIPRLRVLHWLTLFLRGRALLGHSPAVARAESRLSETTRIEVDARTDTGQLSSGFAGVGGVHLHWPFLSLSIAGGYGTWFLPLIELPVGHNTWIAEFDVYFRF